MFRQSHGNLSGCAIVSHQEIAEVRPPRNSHSLAFSSSTLGADHWSWAQLQEIPAEKCGNHWRRLEESPRKMPVSSCEHHIRIMVIFQPTIFVTRKIMSLWFIWPGKPGWWIPCHHVTHRVHCHPSCPITSWERKDTPCPCHLKNMDANWLQSIQNYPEPSQIILWYTLEAALSRWCFCLSFHIFKLNNHHFDEDNEARSRASDPGCMGEFPSPLANTKENTPQHINQIIRFNQKINLKTTDYIIMMFFPWFSYQKYIASPAHLLETSWLQNPCRTVSVKSDNFVKCKWTQIQNPKETIKHSSSGTVYNKTTTTHFTTLWLAISCLRPHLTMFKSPRSHMPIEIPMNMVELQIHPNPYFCG